MPIHGPGRPLPDYSKFISESYKKAPAKGADADGAAGAAKSEARGRWDVVKHDLGVKWDRIKELVGGFKKGEFNWVNNKSIVKDLKKEVSNLNKEVQKILEEKEGITDIERSNALSYLKKIETTYNLFKERNLNTENLINLKAQLEGLTSTLEGSNKRESNNYEADLETFESLLQTLLGNQQVSKEDRKLIDEFLDKGFSNITYIHEDKPRIDRFMKLVGESTNVRVRPQEIEKLKTLRASLEKQSTSHKEILNGFRGLEKEVTVASSKQLKDLEKERRKYIDFDRQELPTEAMRKEFDKISTGMQKRIEIRKQQLVTLEEHEKNYQKKLADSASKKGQLERDIQLVSDIQKLENSVEGAEDSKKLQELRTEHEKRHQELQDELRETVDECEDILESMRDDPSNVISLKEQFDKAYNKLLPDISKLRPVLQEQLNSIKEKVEEKVESANRPLFPISVSDQIKTQKQDLQRALKSTVESMKETLGFIADQASLEGVTIRDELRELESFPLSFDDTEATIKNLDEYLEQLHDVIDPNDPDKIWRAYGIAEGRLQKAKGIQKKLTRLQKEN